MAEFALQSSYQRDYELADFVDNATWEIRNRAGGSTDGYKVQRADITLPDFLTLAAGMGLSSSTAAFVVWPPVAADTGDVLEFDPQSGDVLRFDDDAWIIRRFVKQLPGQWQVICEREKLNTIE